MPIHLRSSLRRVCTLALSMACVWLAPGSAALTGCSSEPDTTTGKRVQHQTQIVNPDAAAFTTGMGWEVKLTKFNLAVGGIYIFDGAPIVLAGRSPRQSQGPSQGQSAAPGLPFIKSAWAHPGHYAAGSAKADMTQPTSVDLLAGTQMLGTASGVSGSYRSATMYFGKGAPQGPQVKELGAAYVVAEGTAKKGADEKPFRFEVTEDDLKNAIGTAGIDGCKFDEVDVQSSGTVVLTVGVKQLFEQVEFETAGISTRDTRAFRGFVFGLRGGSPYRFSFKP
jgi:hypothetical protein